MPVNVCQSVSFLVHSEINWFSCLPESRVALSTQFSTSYEAVARWSGGGDRWGKGTRDPSASRNQGAPKAIQLFKWVPKSSDKQM